MIGIKNNLAEMVFGSPSYLRIHFSFFSQIYLWQFYVAVSTARKIQMYMNVHLTRLYNFKNVRQVSIVIQLYYCVL